MEQVKISVHLCHVSGGCQGEHFWFGYYLEFKQITTDIQMITGVLTHG